ncbi:MAG: hypothetical protein RMJ19_05545 [Gemmatales bacterium]|nr:hypothetical protein [Gemmatales bacterium]MDW8175117.1 hypothetical protein [Gemmatales bacterium]
MLDEILNRLVALERVVDELTDALGVKTVCAKCKGDRVITHPLWSRFYDENADRWPLDRESEIRWWQDHGYKSPEDAPPEEINCDQCYGNGWVVDYSELVELVTALRQNKVGVVDTHNQSQRG